MTVAVVLLALAGAYLVSAVVGSQDFEQPSSIETIKRGTVKQTITANGTFAPRQARYLSFPTDAKVTRVVVKVGDSVSRGDLLARIDATELRSEVLVAEAELESAREQLHQAIKDKSGRATIAVARAGVESAEAGLRLARHNLADAALTSPIDGVVAAVNITKGSKSGQGADAGATSGGSGGEPEMGGPMAMGEEEAGGAPASGNDPATKAAAADMVVIQPGRWVSEISITSSNISRVKKGQPATITPTGSSKKLTGKVRTVAVIGSSSGGDGGAAAAISFPATVAINGKHSSLYIGGTNKVTVTIRQRTGVVTVPTVAITDNGDGPFVTKRVAGEDRETPVKLGIAGGGRTEIRSGLAVGDEIVYESGPDEIDSGVSGGGESGGGESGNGQSGAEQSDGG